ncbi:hypothetical protein Tco_1217465 [Tanacetum coccineum]
MLWVTTEGLPIHTWTHNMFVKVASKWGELIELEEYGENPCPVCAKELETWALVFCEDKFNTLLSDEEPFGDESGGMSGNKENGNINEVERDVYWVSESSFVHDPNQMHKTESNKCKSMEKEIKPDDLFNIYDILNRKEDKVDKSVADDLQCPRSQGNSSQNVRVVGSILEVMNELDKMNFMSLNVQCLGHKEWWIKELCLKYRVNFLAIQETMTEHLDMFSIKALWGKFSFDYVISSSVDKLYDVDKLLDQGGNNEEILNHRSTLLKELNDWNSIEALEVTQKAKVYWLSLEQVDDLEHHVTYDEIKRAVWDCGTNKSPSSDGFTFKFFRRYWKFINQDVVAAVTCFFSFVYEMVLDNDGVASKTTKEKVKSLDLKAKVTKEQTSDDSDSQGGSDEDIDEEE